VRANFAFYRDLGLGAREEPFQTQALVAELAVEALADAVLPRLAGVDQGRLALVWHATNSGPCRSAGRWPENREQVSPEHAPDGLPGRLQGRPLALYSLRLRLSQLDGADLGKAGLALSGPA
jgi:hypothetical protein